MELLLHLYMFIINNTRQNTNSFSFLYISVFYIRRTWTWTTYVRVNAKFSDPHFAMRNHHKYILSEFTNSTFLALENVFDFRSKPFVCWWALALMCKYGKRTKWKYLFHWIEIDLDGFPNSCHTNTQRTARQHKQQHYLLILCMEAMDRLITRIIFYIHTNTRLTLFV